MAIAAGGSKASTGRSGFQDGDLLIHNLVMLADELATLVSHDDFIALFQLGCRNVFALYCPPHERQERDGLQ